MHVQEREGYFHTAMHASFKFGKKAMARHPCWYMASIINPHKMNEKTSLLHFCVLQLSWITSGQHPQCKLSIYLQSVNVIIITVLACTRTLVLTLPASSHSIAPSHGELARPHVHFQTRGKLPSSLPRRQRQPIAGDCTLNSGYPELVHLAYK